MASLVITSWELTPLNPDLTANALLPVLSGSVPTAEVVDFAAMGMQFQLELLCTLSGTYFDTSAAEVSGQLIRYNPGMFVDLSSSYTPVGAVPPGGYSFQVPSNTPATYQMALIGQGDNVSNAENGTVYLEILTSTTFTITHIFRMTTDQQNYLIGNKTENRFRLTKAARTGTNELDISYPTVYGWDKALNAFVSTIRSNNTRYQLSAQELSLAFSASFDNYQNDGIVSDYIATFTIERDSVEYTSLSPFEDNLITVEFQDGAGAIITDEAEVILTYRGLTLNVATFTRDLDIKNSKLITNAGTTQLNGALYNPVTYGTSGPSSEDATISFVIDGTKLQRNKDYQIHIIAAYNDSPSGIKMLHVVSGLLRTDGAPREVDFTMSVETWTRNGNHAQEFTITAGERATSVLSMNKDEYDLNVETPFTTFEDDVDTLTARIYEPGNTTPILQKFIQKNPDGTWTDTDFIGIVDDSPSEPGMFYAYLKEFRTPYENFQDLQDWTDKTYTIQWTAKFMDQTDPTFGAVYEFNSLLHVRGYEDDEPSPSQDVVTDIRFLDPLTGQPITNWCDATEVLVVAQIGDLGDEVFVTAMVDKFPLGADLYNDFALQEEDSEVHDLPDYVVFSEKTSVLISELTTQPDEDGFISFLLDISGVIDEDKMRIYVLAYRVEP